MENQKIPQATAKRILIYYRFMKNMVESGVLRVSSAELSEALKIDSATIRRDFSYFGALGKKGYGYDVEYLLEFFRESFNQDTPIEVALVGVGNLGTAFVNYNFMKNNNTKIMLAFDIDQKKVGSKISGIPIYHIGEIEQRLKQTGIKMAILTVPSAVAQEITDQLVRVGICAILNFSPVPLVVPSHVHLHSIDLAVELQSLAYFMMNYPISENEVKQK